MNQTVIVVEQKSSASAHLSHCLPALFSTVIGMSYYVLKPVTLTTPTAHCCDKMAPTVHVIDPDYDAVIVLKDPSTEFAGEYVLRPPGSGGATENHYQVSSRHLQLASPWFKRTMAAATWAESKLENGKYQVIAHD